MSWHGLDIGRHLWRAPCVNAPCPHQSLLSREKAALRSKTNTRVRVCFGGNIYAGEACEYLILFVRMMAGRIIGACWHFFFFFAFQ